MKKHAFLELAQAQKAGGTSYCGGLDPHLFDSPEENEAVYGKAINEETIGFYQVLAGLCNLPTSDAARYALFVAAVEEYLIRVITIVVEDCNVRVFKPQASFYEALHPLGAFLLRRVRNYIKSLEQKHSIRIVCLLDCKRGDIDTTQAHYFISLLGSLKENLGIDFTPYDFDIINVTPWMGSDVLVLQGLGLELMRKGKGLITVNLSSNPTSAEYQPLLTRQVEEGSAEELQLFIRHARDMCLLNEQYELEEDGLSHFGMVVGSTNECNGSIRAAFPGATHLVPGFGAQGGKFSKIMLELIRDQQGPRAQHNGQGAIFSSSRGTMFAWMKKYGGSDNRDNLKNDLIAAVTTFRLAERDAYEQLVVQDAGIRYPYTMEVSRKG